MFVILIKFAEDYLTLPVIYLCKMKNWDAMDFFALLQFILLLKSGGNEAIHVFKQRYAFNKIYV